MCECDGCKTHTQSAAYSTTLTQHTQVVAADERETQDLRATLNLGHTFGHAIETGTGYGTLLHGEAVSIGMVMAADMSYRLVRLLCVFVFVCFNGYGTLLHGEAVSIGMVMAADMPYRLVRLGSCVLVVCVCMCVYCI